MPRLSPLQRKLVDLIRRHPSGISTAEIKRKVEYSATAVAAALSEIVRRTKGEHISRGGRSGDGCYLYYPAGGAPAPVRPSKTGYVNPWLALADSNRLWYDKVLKERASA